MWVVAFHKQVFVLLTLIFYVAAASLKAMSGWYIQLTYSSLTGDVVWKREGMPENAHAPRHDRTGTVYCVTSPTGIKRM